MSSGRGFVGRPADIVEMEEIELDWGGGCREEEELSGWAEGKA